MLQKLQNHINTNLSFLKEKKLLLAVSGGIDSMVLVHLCHQLKLDFSVAHCNFQLRGKESLEDQLFVSAKTGQGLEQLKGELLKVAGWQPESEGGILARKRHVEALLNAEQHIKNALVLLKAQTSSIELAAEEMRLAQDELSTITGQFLPDDLLGKIFSTFCIGK